MMPPDNGGKPDAARMVEGFRNPVDAFLSMAKIHQGEAHTWGIYASRHSRRAKRNAHRLEIMRHVALATRSEEAWGSHEAADVARGNAQTPGNMLDTLLGTAPTPKPPAPNAPQPTEGSR